MGCQSYSPRWPSLQAPLHQVAVQSSPYPLQIHPNIVQEDKRKQGTFYKEQKGPSALIGPLMSLRNTGARGGMPGAAHVNNVARGVFVVRLIVLL